MRAIVALCLLLLVSTALLSFAVPALADELEQDLQNGLADSESLVETIQAKLAKNDDIINELARLRSIADAIRTTSLLLEERFRLREQKTKTLGSKALDRQRAVTEGFRRALTEYLSIIDGLPASGNQRSAIKNFASLLAQLHPRKHRPIIGSLPYRHLNLPVIEPTNAASVTPAYKGGDRTVRPEDTADSIRGGNKSEVDAFPVLDKDWWAENKGKSISL